VTTRNARKAQAIQKRMDDLEARIVDLQAREALEAMRPPIDGDQIMQHTGMKPGPLVGQAWEWLLELRLEVGPVSEDDAYRALDDWWAAVDAGDEPPAPDEVAERLGIQPVAAG
jgi:poly(A) polymerase